MIPERGPQTQQFNPNRYVGLPATTREGVADTQVPRLRYLGLGICGDRQRPGGEANIDTDQFRPNPFSPIPFRPFHFARPASPVPFRLSHLALSNFACPTSPVPFRLSHFALSKFARPTVPVPFRTWPTSSESCFARPTLPVPFRPVQLLIRECVTGKYASYPPHKYV